MTRRRRRGASVPPDNVATLDAITFTDYTPPSGATADDISALAFRNDGSTGTAVAVGPLPFAPGTVQPADLASLTAWSGATELACYVADPGARHLGTDDEGSVLYAWVEVERPFAVANTDEAITFKFTEPVGVTRRASSVCVDTTAWDAYRLDNPLSVAVGTDPTKLQLTAAGAFYFHSEDTVRRWAAGDLAWDTSVAGSITSLAGHATLYRPILCLLCAKADNSVVVVPFQGTDVAALDDAPRHQSDNLSTAYQVIGTAAIYLPPAYGTFTIGTTEVNADGLTVTTTGGTYQPREQQPRDLPLASITLAAAADLCAARLLPGAEIETAAASAARGAIYSSVEARIASSADYTWRIAGTYGLHNAGGNTVYAGAWVEYQRHCRTGDRRHFRRALAYFAPWRELLANAGLGTDPDGATYQSISEPADDGTMATVSHMLAGNPRAKAVRGHIAYVNEYQVLRQYYTTWTLAPRQVSRVMAELALLARAGACTTWPGPDTTPYVGSEDAFLVNAANATGITGHAARYQRLARALANFAIARPDGQPGQALNCLLNPTWAGTASDTTTFPFQQNLALSASDVARRTLDPAGGDTESATLLQLTRDVTLYLLQGADENGADIQIGAAGNEQFYYSTGNPAVDGAVTNGFLFGFLPSLINAFPSDAATLRAAGDTLYAAMDQSLDFRGKTVGEAAWWGDTWPNNRGV